MICAPLGRLNRSAPTESFLAEMSPAVLVVEAVQVGVIEDVEARQRCPRTREADPWRRDGSSTSQHDGWLEQGSDAWCWAVPGEHLPWPVVELGLHGEEVVGVAALLCEKPTEWILRLPSEDSSRRAAYGTPRSTKCRSSAPSFRE
jgi:hypothetical protein